jgi:hypothetical protein
MFIAYFPYFEQVLGRTNRLLSLIRHGQFIKRRIQQFFCCCVYIRCRGNASAKPLPSKDRGIHIHTDRWKGFMKYVVEMGSSAMICIPRFIKIGSSFQKLTEGFTDTRRSRKPSLCKYDKKSKSWFMRSPCCLCVCESPPIKF